MRKAFSALLSITTAWKRQTAGRTVRYMFMFPLVIGAGVWLGAAAITSQDVSYVKLVPSTSIVEEGKQFSIDVYAYAHVPVNAVDITLRFDPSAVTVLGVDTGQSVITLWTQKPIIKTDSVILRGGTFRNGFVKEHLIATLNLVGKRAGKSSFAASDVILLAGDGNGSSVSVAQSKENSDLSLYIYDKNTDPATITIDAAVKIVTDIDGDGKVTIRDVSVFMAAWATKDKIFDFNGDGRMTFVDFSIILSDMFFK